MTIGRIARPLLFLAMAALLAGCVGSGPDLVPQPSPDTPVLSAGSSARNFAEVVARMQPVLVEECRARTKGVSCAFQILVDDRPGQPANAMQTLDKHGRPVIMFTVALIREARNADELAFILGHEGAHHIEGHIPRQNRTAMAGGLLAGVVAAASGADRSTIEAAQNVGANVAARSYAKDYELEADALGTIIAFRAGFNPERGAEFFARIPDPGNRFLGTHPPNAARIAMVRRTMDSLR